MCPLLPPLIVETIKGGFLMKTSKKMAVIIATVLLMNASGVTTLANMVEQPDFDDITVAYANAQTCSSSFSISGGTAKIRASYSGSSSFIKVAMQVCL